MTLLRREIVEDFGQELYDEFVEWLGDVMIGRVDFEPAFMPCTFRNFLLAREGIDISEVDCRK